MSNWSTQIDVQRSAIQEIDSEIASLQNKEQELNINREVHVQMLAILTAADKTADTTVSILDKVPMVNAENLPLAPELMVVVLGKLLPHAPKSLLVLGSIGAGFVSGTINLFDSLSNLTHKSA